MLQSVHILWAVTAPQNNIYVNGSKKYSGVGGHLFAIAGRKSLEYGYGGFVYGEAMDKEILDYYINNFGAQHFLYGIPKHDYRLIIDESAMKKIMEVYDFEDNGESL